MLQVPCLAGWLANNPVNTDVSPPCSSPLRLSCREPPRSAARKRLLRLLKWSWLRADMGVALDEGFANMECGRKGELVRLCFRAGAHLPGRAALASL